MAGRVVAIRVDYLTEAPEGPQRTVVDLGAMRAHCRPERLEDLLDDLVVLCDDVLAGLQTGDPLPVLKVVRGSSD